MAFKLKGRGKFELASRRKRRAAVRGLAAGLYKEAEGIMTLSKQAYVPVLTGALRNSGFVASPRIKTNKASVDLGFGGPAAPYAVFVHENLHAFHHVGQAKYLEIPLLGARRGMPKRLARDVRQALKSG